MGNIGNGHSSGVPKCGSYHSLRPCGIIALKAAVPLCGNDEPIPPPKGIGNATGAAVWRFRSRDPSRCNRGVDDTDEQAIHREGGELLVIIVSFVKPGQLLRLPLL